MHTHKVVGTISEALGLLGRSSPILYSIAGGLADEFKITNNPKAKMRDSGSSPAFDVKVAAEFRQKYQKNADNGEGFHMLWLEVN